MCSDSYTPSVLSVSQSSSSNVPSEPAKYVSPFGDNDTSPVVVAVARSQKAADPYYNLPNTPDTEDPHRHSLQEQQLQKQINAHNKSVFRLLGHITGESYI